MYVGDFKIAVAGINFYKGIMLAVSRITFTPSAPGTPPGRSERKQSSDTRSRSSRT